MPDGQQVDELDRMRQHRHVAAGHDLDEHEAPEEATLQVLQGRVRLTAGEETWEGGAGELLIIPPARHDLLALEDAVVLLSVGTGA